MTTIGEVLADARRGRKATIKDAEKALKIRAKHIAALEQNAFEDIAGDAYVTGFLRSYAIWLGVDPKPLVERYREEVRGQTQAAPKPRRLGVKVPRVVVPLGIGAMIFLMVKWILEKGLGSG